jgi:CRISPR-associated protein Csh1
VIKAVSSIGNYVQGMNSGGDSLSKIIENPDSNGKYKQVLLVALKENEGDYSFSHVETQGFKEYTKYLYKGKQGNALDATPTSRVTEVKKTFKKFYRWFENYDDYPLSVEEKESIRRMGEAIKAEYDKIQADLQDKFSRRKSGESSIITLGFDDGVNIKYLSDIPIFRNVLLNKGSKAFSTKYGIESIGKDEMCSVCGDVKEEVYSFAVPWTFHNYDKPGNIAGGFDVAESWKNTPICFDCATCLEKGKIYIEDKLDFNFVYGFRYLLIPKLALGGDIKDIMTILGAKDRKKTQTLNQEVKRRLTADEGDILDIVAKQSDSISTSLMFYEVVKSQYNILLLVEGILPSRLNQLFRIKDKVDKRFEPYRDIALSEPQREKNPLVFNFGVVRRFFPSEKEKGDFAAKSKSKISDKMFMEVVNKIFVGNSIDYQLLIGFITERIRDAFDKNAPTNISTLYGFLLLHYLNELGILKNITSAVDNMNRPSEGNISIVHLEGLSLEQKITSFFESNKAFFSSDAKKATFLEGILTQKLLNIQFTDKKATPFRDKLHGLRMNEALIKRLLPEIQNKLEEYKKNYYRDLEEIIARYFIHSGVNWIESNDDLSFYFVLGMNSYKLFEDVDEEEDIEGMT